MNWCRKVTLEHPVWLACSPPMDEPPHHKPPADWDPPVPSADELLAALAESESELAAGLTVDGDALIREL